MTRLASLVLVLVGALALTTGACTTSSNNSGQQDAGHHQLDGGFQFDSGHDGGGGQDGGGGACTKTGFTAVEQVAEASASGLGYSASSSASEPVDILSIEFYYGYGDPPPLQGPGTFELGVTPDEKNYATCGTCVLVYAGCGASSCAQYFFATGGTLNVTAFTPGGNFTGTLTDATLVEVTIDTSTYTSTPVAGGDTWCLSSYAFDAPLSGTLPCTSSTQCASTPETPVCDTEYSTCVQCLVDGDCTALTATPHCDSDYTECVECVTDAHCASNANGTKCAGGLCGLCASSFDCTNVATPVCAANKTTNRGECVAGVTCTGDDPGGAADTGPAGARVLTIATAMAGSICDATADYDFYKFTTSAVGNITVTMSWAATDADLDFVVLDATGTVVDSGASVANPEVLALTAQAAGTYYVVVYAYDVGAATAALPYSLTVTTP